jgi:SOUL heme-binding protein
METLPQPDDYDVTLVEVPAQTYAVLRFSGARSPREAAARTGELLATLKGRDIEPLGEATAWFFDPPWTLPFRRRNEIAIPVGDP